MKAPTTSEILNINLRDLAKMSEKELRQSVSTLRSTARKRYWRVVESDVQSQAVNSLRSGSKGDSVFPSIRGMDIVQLRNEFKRYRQFLTGKTSTVKGARAVEEKTRKMVSEMANLEDGEELTSEEVAEILSIADELSAREIASIMSSTERISAVTQEYKGNKRQSKSELMEKAHQRLVETYEENENGSSILTSKYMQ